MTMQSASATDRDTLVLPRIGKGRRDTRGVLRRMQWAAIATCLLGLTACGGSGRADWPLPNLDLASSRALAGSGIDRNNVRSLRVAWRFRFRIPPGESGAFTATPVVAGGGGAWETPSVADGEVFWGTSNPYPYGGSRAHPNGGAYAGAALYTDSLVALDAKTGKLAWYDQVTRHDVRDYDFQLPPVLGSAGGREEVFGAGKAGLVVAWDRATHQRLWQTEVGVHR